MLINWYKAITSSMESILPPEEERFGFKDIFNKLTNYEIEFLQNKYDFKSFFKPGGEGGAFLDSKTDHVIKITEEQTEFFNSLKIMNETNYTFFVPIFDVFKLPESGVYVIEEGKAIPLSETELEYIKYIHNNMVLKDFSEHIFSPYYPQELADQMKYSKRFLFDIDEFFKLFSNYINLLKEISDSGFDYSDTHEDNIGWYNERLVRFDFGHM